MAPQRLPFEKEIYEMEDLLAKLEADADSRLSHSDQIRRIRRELVSLKRKIYGRLTPWQTVQVARHIDPIKSLVATGAQDLWQDVSYIDEALVARAHSINAKVIAWTANDVEEWETLRRMGVDGICTDRIAELATYDW